MAAEVVLKAEDANEWSYRGEGAANLVLAYTGNSHHFVGKVLRIQKVSVDGSQVENDHLALSSHECLLWKDAQELVLAPTRELVEHYYTKHIMSPLLGSKHVDAGTRVPVSREFLEAVERNVCSNRPSWRVDAATVNVLCDYALLISDHSIFHHGMLKDKACVSVEIKPKCGFLPLSKFIAEDNVIKRSISRFKMHQALKAHEKKISGISHYDPLDMFSGSEDRVLKAVKALFRAPQNNFRVFLNGSLIYGDLGGGAKSNDTVDSQHFEDAIKCIISGKDGEHKEHFLELVADALCKSGVLHRLLEVQKLDVIDIEGAIHAYYNVVSEPCVVCREISEDELLKRYSDLHLMTLDENLKITRDYLIAATAKDLSMMLTFRSREKGDANSLYDVLFLEPGNQTFEYKVSFLDLDMKPLRKMQYYYELDQQIVRFYVRTVSSEPCLGNGCLADNSESHEQSVMQDHPLTDA